MVTESKVLTREEALKKGVLENRKIRLKPIERGGRMITDKSHVGYFMFDGATVHYCLPQDDRGVLVSPFKNTEEVKFFESELDVSLNLHRKEDNYWNRFYVSITKDAEFMHTGKEFDLSDPLDNLRVRVLSLQSEVASGWETRLDRPEYRFVLVPEDYQDEEVAKEMDQHEQVWTYWGSIKGSVPKMKDFLSMYLMDKKTSKQAPVNPSRDFLLNEIGKLLKEDKSGVIRVINDPNSKYKLFIAKAVEVGAIEKTGANTYNFVGEGYKFGLDELIKEVKHYEDTTDDIYLRILAQIERADKSGKKVTKAAE